MHFGFLSPNLVVVEPALKRLAEESKKLGGRFSSYNISECAAYCSNDGLGVYDFSKGYLLDVDVIYPAVVSTVREPGLALLRHFELMKVPSLNTSAGLAMAMDKFQTTQKLAEANIPTIATLLVNEDAFCSYARDFFPDQKAVIKRNFSGGGIGVALAESDRSFLSVLQSMQCNEDKMILAQPFIDEAEYKDKRVFILDGKIVGSMERQAHAQDFRSNHTQGGTVNICDLSDDEKRIVDKTVALFGLDMVGIDIINTAKGPAVLEVNGAPSFIGLEKATGLNIARAIVELACKKYEESLAT